MSSTFKSAVESTYKARDVEEIIDIYFYRPLGYQFARVCRALKVTPNTVTIVSIVIGVAAGHLFYYRDVLLNILGIVFWIVADTLDSTDGQLARMTNHRSKIGRILDGLAGNIMFLSIYLHLFGRMVLTYPGVGWLWLLLLTLGGGISHSLQSSLADYYRNAYLKFVVDPSRSELEGADEIKTQYEEIRFVSNPVKKILMRVYLNYTIQQESLSRNFQYLRRSVDASFNGRAPSWFRDEYRRMNLPLMKYYAILTTNTRMILMSLCVIFDSIPLYFALEIIGINGVMVYVMMQQERYSAHLSSMLARMKAVEA